MSNQAIDIRYELDESEINDIVITDLQEYYELNLEFLKDPKCEDVEHRQATATHIKAVLKLYMGRNEFIDYMEGIENEKN
jgi:hypothetical protein